MRIIGGKLKGRTIALPKDYKARPTTDFAREGLFNVLTNEFDFKNLSVLDLFGGTGAISYEFASRGVPEIYCIEMSQENSSFIKRKVENIGLSEYIKVVRHNVFDFLNICSKTFDLIFADPPYSLSGLETLPDKVLAAGILNPEGYFILEHPGTFSFSERKSFVKEKKYGNVHFSFFTK